MMRRIMFVSDLSTDRESERGHPGRSGWNRNRYREKFSRFKLDEAAAARMAALRNPENASILVGLLWCLALLSIVVIGVLHTATLDLRVVKNYGDQIQAHYLALAGIEKAKALLYQDANNRKRSSQNHSGDLYDTPEQFRDVPFGRGQFRVFHQGRQDEGGKILYGVSDEESRLNVNRASTEELGNLGKLYKMTPDVVASIIDWRDGDNIVTPNGAEAEYYATLQPPYLPRNGQFQTTRELLMVRGVSRDLFLGEDANQNGLLDPEEDDGNATYPPDNRDGILDAGWSGMVTMDSSVRNVNAAGLDRVNVQSADENSLTSVKGISSELAKAIIASRGQNRLESLADLLDVSAVNQQNQLPSTVIQTGPGGGRRSQTAQSQNYPITSTVIQTSPGGGRSSPAAQPANNPAPQASGPKLVSEDLLMDIADDITTADDQSQAGVININTASAEVLACLPGIDQHLAQAIVSYRQSAGFFPNVAWLLKVSGMTRQIFKQVASRVSARSETFRILSEGKVTSTGARKRIQVIVHLGASTIETLSYREDL